MGLSINRNKSCAVSLVASGRQKKVKQVSEQLFTLNGLPLPQKHLVEVWTYLGIDFAGSRVKNVDRTLTQDLLKLSRAPLKPLPPGFSLRGWHGVSASSKQIMGH